jgi:hypothetical protein
MKFTVANMSKITQTEIHLAFGFQNFLTNVGGFLGLYVGCSMISIFEVFYFTFMNVHQVLMKSWKGQEGSKGLTLAQIWTI